MGCSGSKHGTSDPPYSQLPEEKDASKPLNVIILGRHKVGKNSVGNAILGKRVFTFWSFFHKGCVEKQGNVDGRFIKVVHAPGWTGFNHTTSPYNKGEIEHSIIREGRVAFVLVVSIDSQFTKQDWEAVNQHMGLIKCGNDSVWRHTVLVFIEHRSDNKGETKIEHRSDLVRLLEKCERRWFMFNKDKNEVTKNDITKNDVTKNDVTKNDVTKLLKLLDDVATQDNDIQPKNSACSQNCPEERAEKENGGLQQGNIELQKQATTSIRRGTTQESHHESSSASENTSGQLRKVYNIHEPSGPDSQQDADPPPSSSTSTTREVAQAEDQENKKLLERRHNTRMAIKTQKQKMVKFCSLLMTITDTTVPIDENLADFKDQSALFVDEYSAELIERVTTTKSIADSLLAKNMIDRQLCDEIQKAGIDPDKMRLIYRALNTKEKRVAFLELLIQKDRFLVRDLAEKKLQELEASDDVH